MGERGNLRERLLKLWSARPQPPLHIEPRHRISGPAIVPSDWYTDEGQKLVLHQCTLCHERVLPGEALKRGMCGPCYLRTSNNTPEAA